MYWKSKVWSLTRRVRQRQLQNLINNLMQQQQQRQVTFEAAFQIEWEQQYKDNKVINIWTFVLQTTRIQKKQIKNL